MAQAEGTAVKARIIVLAAAMIFVVGSDIWAQAKPAPAAPAAATNPQAAQTAQAVDETALPIADRAGVANADAGSNSILPYVLRMVLVLGLVIAAIYGLFALLRRYSRKPGPPDAYLRVLASVNLSPARSVHVVAVGDKAWLVGSTDSSVQLISAIDDKEVVDALTLRAAAAPETPRADFISMLASSLGMKGGRKIAEPGDFFSRQKDRLKKM